MPPAYAIARLDIHDPEGYEKYRSRVPEVVANYGGRFLVRGGRLETLEGDPPASRIVVIEFPSLEKARAWYSSDAYQELIPLRQHASRGGIFIVEGVAP